MYVDVYMTVIGGTVQMYCKNADIYFFLCLVL